MLINLIISFGRFILESFKTFVEFTGFSMFILKSLLKFDILNPSIFLVFVRQVYFTGVQILPVFTAISFGMGIIFVGFLTNFLANLNAYEQIGNVLSVLIVRELAPLVSVIMLSLRSSTAVSAEMSVMNIMKETDTLKMYGIDITKYLYLPRIVAGLLSMVSLSTFFTVISIFGGYLLISFQMNITIEYMLKLLFDYLTISDIFCFTFKVTSFGFLLMAVPIFTSRNIKSANTEIPIALLKGMMRLFYGIVLVEALGFLI